MASLPFISTFAIWELPSLLFYGNDDVGTHARAACAADAGILIDALSGMIALGIDAHGRHLQNMLRTEGHTQTATLALFFVKGNFCHFLPFLPSAVTADPTLDSKTRQKTMLSH